MDDEIKSKLLEWIERIEHAADQGGAFIVAEAPKVASEYLTLIWWESFLITLVGVSVLLIAYGFGRWVFQKTENWTSTYDREMARSAVVPLAIVAILLGGGASLFGAFNLVKVSVAPRVVILEKLGDLTR